MIRSLLFVPAEEKKLNKIQYINADAFIIDIEDSIKTHNKQIAIENICNYLKKSDVNKKLFVRINPQNWDNEIRSLKNFKEISFAIPKVDDVDDLKKYEKYIKEKSLLVFIESPQGMINLEKIIKNKWVGAIGFGAEDYCVKTGKKKDSDNLRYEQSKLILYAKANGIPVFDMVESEYDDLNLFLKKTIKTKELGFDGKLAIHPKQIEVINSVYITDIEKIQKIIDIYDASDSGFVMIDGTIYERPHIENFKKIIKEELGQIKEENL